MKNNNFKQSVTPTLFHNYVVGFIDAEGCFNISISKHPKTTTGYTVQLKIHITQHTKSVTLLHEIKNFFGCGTKVIHNKSEDRIRFQITALNQIKQELIPFLDRYPLLTSKYLNYLDFKVAVEILSNKEHLTLEGLERLKALAENMNTGRSFIDKWSFCSKIQNLLTPEWILGFADGESCFSCTMIKTSTSNNWKFNFSVSQHISDRYVLERIKKFFYVGHVYPKICNLRSEFSTKMSFDINAYGHISKFVVNSELDLFQVIIPFFDKYPLFTTKSLDYQIWRKLLYIKKNNIHKTHEGFEQIISLKSEINRGRKWISS